MLYLEPTLDARTPDFCNCVFRSPMGSVAHFQIPQPAKHHTVLSILDNGTTNANAALWTREFDLAQQVNSTGVFYNHVSRDLKRGC